MTTKLLIAAVVSAFAAKKAMHAQLQAALPKMTGKERTTFVWDAAKALAAANGLTAYAGQRGIAFGVPVLGDDGKTVVSYERTEMANATRMWFSRNIVAYLQPSAPKGAPDAVWESIVSELSEARKVAQKLSPAKQKSFNRALAALIAEFSE
jgi:hypothetical protein